MKTCKYGHPWVPENRRQLMRHGKKNGSRCIPCESIPKDYLVAQPRKLTCKYNHGTKYYARQKNGRAWCKICDSRRLKMGRQGIFSGATEFEEYLSLPIFEEDHVTMVQFMADGWEDEFGPVPPPEHPSEFYDWVMVYRAAYDEPLSRSLSPKEMLALAKVGTEVAGLEFDELMEDHRV